MDRQLVMLLAQLDRLQLFYPRVEGRATFLFAVVLAQLGILAANFPLKDPISFSGFLAGFTVLLHALCIWRIYGTLFPHLDPAPRSSLVYFGDVAKLDELTYCRRIKAISDVELVDDVASQVWRNSEILALKFSRMKQAFQVAAFALAPWLFFLATVAINSGVTPKFTVG
jgi:hypothetical protein